MFLKIVLICMIVALMLVIVLRMSRRMAGIMSSKVNIAQNSRNYFYANYALDSYIRYDSDLLDQLLIKDLLDEGEYENEITKLEDSRISFTACDSAEEPCPTKCQDLSVKIECGEQPQRGNDVLKEQKDKNQCGSSILKITRAKSFVGRDVSVSVFLDGGEVYRIVNDATAYIHTTPGEHIMYLAGGTCESEKVYFSADYGQMITVDCFFFQREEIGIRVCNRE